MGGLYTAAMSAAMGAFIGAGGMAVSSMLQVGRLPPKANMAGAAAFMGTVLGAGSFVRR